MRSAVVSVQGRPVHGLPRRTASRMHPQAGSEGWILDARRKHFTHRGFPAARRGLDRAMRESTLDRLWEKCLHSLPPTPLLAGRGPGGGSGGGWLRPPSRRRAGRVAPRRSARSPEGPRPPATPGPGCAAAHPLGPGWAAPGLAAPGRASWPTGVVAWRAAAARLSQARHAARGVMRRRARAARTGPGRARLSMNPHSPRSPTGSQGE